MQRRPCSPGLSPVELEDCLEELLKFTLQSHINGTLDVDHDLGFPTDFSSHLLNHNDRPGTEIQIMNPYFLIFGNDSRN